MRLETSPEYARVLFYPCLRLMNDKDRLILVVSVSEVEVEVTSIF